MMRLEPVYLGGRRVRAFGLGAASPLGLSVAADGSAHWDSSVMYQSLPPATRTAAADVADCVAHPSSCDLTKTLHDAEALVVMTIAAANPIAGLVAGVIIGLINAIPIPPAVTDLSYASLICGGQSYDAGMIGTFQSYANATLRATYDGLVASGKMGSIDTALLVLASALTACIQSWNDTHAGPSAPYRVTVNVSNTWHPTGWNQHQPADCSPISVAANALYLAQTRAPVVASGGVPLTFDLNGGSAIAPPVLNPRIAEPASTSPTRKLVVGSVVVAGGAAGALWWYATKEGVSMAGALKRLVQ